jgi:hypothetical protein
VLTFSNAVFFESSVDNRQCTTEKEAAPRGKNWQQRRAGCALVCCQSLDLDGTSFVPANLTQFRSITCSRQEIMIVIIIRLI